MGLGRLLEQVPGMRSERSEQQFAKYQFWREHADEVDVVFVGSSRFYRGIDPAAFDRSLAERGRPVRSFNFGLPGMWFHELAYTVDWILDREPERLRWVFIELQEIDPEFQSNRLTHRTVNYHDPAVTWLACRTTLAADRPLLGRLDEVRAHLLHLGYKLGNVGQGLSALEALLGRAPEPAPRDFDGFVSLDEEERDQARREEEGENPRPRERVEGPPDELFLTVVRDLVARVRAAGAEPILVVGPLAGRWPALEHAQRDGSLPNVLAYNDPRRLPQLYQRRYLHDRGHLNAAGASVFAGLLADDLDRLLRERGE